MDLGWSSDTVNVHVDIQCKTPEMKDHKEKFMDVSDVQVSDKDGHLYPSMAIKAISKIVKERIWTIILQFANKIAKERIWTLDSPSRQQD